MKQIATALLAESLGTTLVVFTAAGAAGGDRLAAALAYGLATAAAVEALAPFSGGHLNPAVSFAHWVARRMGFFRLLAYVVAQLVGSLLAAWLLRWSLPEGIGRRTALAAPLLGPDTSRAQAMVIECLLTFLVASLFFVRRRPTAWAIGAAIASGVLVAQPFSGAALNPARAFGPQILSRHWMNFGVWWIGPLGGGALAGWLCGDNPTRSGVS